MTGFEKNNESVELSPEALEQVAGGAKQSKHIMVTKNTYLREGSGENFPVTSGAYSGQGLIYFGPSQADECGVNWYGAGRNTGSVVIHHISSKCCKFV